MIKEQLAQAVRERLPREFEISPRDDGSVQVWTPFLYPDRDVIDVFVRETGGLVQVADGGAFGWLYLNCGFDELSELQNHLLHRIERSTDAVFRDGEFVFRCSSLDQIGQAVFSVAHAASRFADLTFTMPASAYFRARRDQAVGEIAEWLREREIAIELDARATGKSGREWPVDLKASVPGLTSWIFVAGGADRDAASRWIDRAYAAAVDLAGQVNGVQPAQIVSIFDDACDVWLPADEVLLRDVSRVAHWPNRLEIASVLSSRADAQGRTP